jgi:pilus assembly protein CpaE
VGTTTIAVNLSVQLAHSLRRRTVLFDLGRPLGHAALLLDLETRFNFRAAVESLDRLDSNLFSGFLATHKSGVHVLAGASHADEWEHVTSAALARVINVGQGAFESVVADLGATCSSEWIPILRLAHRVVMVSETNVPSLWSLERQLSLLRSLGVDSERIRLVINRWHRADEEPLGAFEKRVKMPIAARIPNDYKQVSRAVNMGIALTTDNNDQLVHQFRVMAEEISGLGHGAPAKRSSILSLFSSKR